MAHVYLSLGRGHVFVTSSAHIIINYYYWLFIYSLRWCPFCASSRRKPYSWTISHSSQSFCSYSKHLPADSCRSQHADLLDLCHSDTFLMFSTIPFFTVPSAPTPTGITSVFICHILCISSSRSLYYKLFKRPKTAVAFETSILLTKPNGCATFLGWRFSISAFLSPWTFVIIKTTMCDLLNVVTMILTCEICRKRVSLYLNVNLSFLFLILSG